MKKGKVKLQYRITILIFVILLIVGVAGGALILHFQRQSAISQFEDSALIVAEALYDSLVSDMRAARREHIQDSVARVASRPQINEAIIVSKEQRVYASGDISEIGQIRDDDEIAEALASAKVVSRTEKQYGRNEVCVIVPIINQPECYACHGADTRVLGAIEIGLDRENLDA